MKTLKYVYIFLGVILVMGTAIFGLKYAVGSASLIKDAGFVIFFVVGVLFTIVGFKPQKINRLTNYSLLVFVMSLISVISFSIYNVSACYIGSGCPPTFDFLQGIFRIFLPCLIVLAFVLLVAGFSKKNNLVN